MSAQAIVTLRAVALEPTYWDLEHYEIDAEQVVSRLADNGVNGIRLGAQSHDGCAYFPSEVVPEAPGLRSRDLVGDFKAACQRHNLYFIVYTNAMYVRDGVYPEQEEWVVRGPNGQFSIREPAGICLMCQHSPYFDKYLTLLAEIGSRYNPDVMYIDCFGASVLCHCQRCQQRYQEVFGKSLPSEVNWQSEEWRQYFQWINQDTDEHARRIVAACRSHRGDMPVVFNRASPWSALTLPEDLRSYATEIADGVHGETAVRMYGQGFHHIDEQAAIGEAYGSPLWCWVEHNSMPWSHLPGHGSELKIKAAKVLAHGARPMVWSLPLAPEPDYRGIEAVGQVFRVAADNSELLDNTEAVAEVALLFPSTSALLFDKRVGEDPGPHSLAAAASVREEFLGFMDAARRSHIPVRVVLEGDISSELAADCPMLILPNAACLTEEVCAGIRAYCAAGGRILATFATSLRDAEGHPRDEFALRELLGCRLIQPLPLMSTDIDGPGRQGSYVTQLGRHPLFQGLEGEFELPAGGRALAVAAEGQVPGTLRAPSAYYCSYPGPPRDIAALVISPGSIYIPWQLGRTYHHHKLASLRRFIANIIDYLEPTEPLIKTDLPPSVTVTLRRAPTGALVLHLVNLSCEPEFEVEQVTPVTGASISLRKDLCSQPRPRVLGTEEQLPLTQQNDRWHIQLPNIEEFCIIAVGV